MSCCAPGRPAGGARGVESSVVIGAPGSDVLDSYRPIPGGRFLMGSEAPEAIVEDGEGPVRKVEVAPFLLDAHAVSNRRFASFVEDTSYTTDAERYGWSFVFVGFLSRAAARGTQAAAAAPWWRAVEGACWRRPEGPNSGLTGRDDHPAVHVSHTDALAFCSWAGARLPSEAEWEYAARGGLEQKPFPWGEELAPGGEWRCNVWQGSFPDRDTGEDGYRGTAPVDAFESNAFSLHNVVGNAWEWTADWFRGPGVPPGTARVMRGGSYLCHASYCNRYRTSARSPLTPDSSTGNVGFRCARDVEA
jgi:sulfatase modifying factor 1